MSRAVRIGGGIAIALVAVVSLGAGTVYSVSGSKLGRSYDVPLTTVDVPAPTAEVLARGEHLASAVLSCMECHGPDLGGTQMIDDPMGLLAASNLTRGRGGIGGAFTDEDWVRAIRHGLRADGTSLLVMPSDAYGHLSDADLGALVAYLKELPPVDRELPAPKLRLLGRALLAAGELDDILIAGLVPPIGEHPPVEVGVTVEYGHYLARISGCTSCHKPDLSGGKLGGPPGTPPSTNLTPAALADWSEEDFFRSMRTGMKPDGTQIDVFMPWRFIGQMTDEELRAIWLYVQSVPARETVVQ
jgi:mono/diheme cytochrome c family protein